MLINIVLLQMFLYITCGNSSFISSNSVKPLKHRLFRSIHRSILIEDGKKEDLATLFRWVNTHIEAIYTAHVCIFLFSQLITN